MHLSYWEKEYLLKDIEHLVVGAGFTGLQTAIKLKLAAPGAKVVVVDRHPWSQGGSLKNAGFACFANISEILDDLKINSPEQVYGTVKKRYEGLKDLVSLCGAASIDLTYKGSVEYFDKQNRTALMAALDAMGSVNSILSELLDLDRVFTYRSKGFENFDGQIVNAYEGQLNTGKLYGRLMEIAQQMGIRMYGGLNLKGWSVADKVEVDLGAIACTTRQLFICTNAFAQDKEIVPARGQVIVSAPLEKLPQGLGMYDNGYYYWRDIDGRLLLGGARNKDEEGERTDSFGPNEKVQQALREFMFDKLLGKEVQIDYQWSGIMGMGPKGHEGPLIKTLDKGVFLGARLGGMGVALSAKVAQELVELLHTDD